MRSPRILLLVTAFLCFGVLVAPPASGQTRVRKLTLNGCTAQVPGGVYGARFTIGQTLVGQPHGSVYRGRLGFWEMIGLHHLSAVDDLVPSFSNALRYNHPNPFNPSTEISFSLEKESEVQIDVFDLKGRKMARIFQEVRPAGTHSFNYTPRKLSSGVYLVRMRAGSFQATQRIMLIK